jgi:hypothetical protein
MASRSMLIPPTLVHHLSFDFSTVMTVFGNTKLVAMKDG